MLNDNTVGCNAREGDVLVGNARDGSSGTGDGLDTDTVGRVLDSRGFNDDIGDNVVGTSTDRSDGETVTTRTGSTGEGNTSTGVDSETVILVLNDGTGDGDIAGGTNIESIGVVAKGTSISSRVVNVDVGESKTGSTVDGEDLNWRVQDVDTRDC